MRITHVIDTLDPANGGPPLVAASLAKAQANLGHDVSLAVETAAGFSGLPVCVLPRHRAWHAHWLFPDVNSLARRSEILHLHGVWEPVLAAVARAARQVGTPYVITLHGMLDPWSLAQKSWKKKLALALGYRTMLNRASALHVLNEDERKLIAPLGLQTLSHVIPNGIFLDELNPPPDPRLFRRQCPEIGDHPYILFLGRLHHKKGLDLLADAFAAIATKHADVQLVVAGPDAGEEQPFRKRIEQLGLSKRTKLTGPLYGPLKWSAIAGAAIFCLPSRQEGFSVAILEAMACRVPVVVTETCHFPEVAEFGAGRVVSLNANSISATLDSLLDDPVAGKNMGDAGRALVESRFCWPKVAEQTISLYARLHKNVAAR